MHTRLFCLIQKETYLVPREVSFTSLLRSSHRFYADECQDNNNFAQHWPFSPPTQKKKDFILTYTIAFTTFMNDMIQVGKIHWVSQIYRRLQILRVEEQEKRCLISLSRLRVLEYHTSN